ncbi:hypothetical protein TVAG_390800 [Trichomonas vaginalis G3]|uniref:Uncharacterized protein n=1 Tax=Trichomonas vaginalis (strain ATCC PRA-98 / G3) TaxID=412133 RepID=A2FDZ4_TRIV3|nr:O-acyltransferase protein [Trichomonas vaginalis G3]EAX96873.1 hypothetical protein TVAG_390800 [Trichomonas vaginalis G3]KAI5534791.1 O-acyltransferase protein [Trichomonas vaginalis G3]|eukprot:XP_001309803.1 hypothetical protein [Trichomonas vaginalis G3]
MYEYSYNITKSYPAAPGVKTTIFYNSGIATTDVLDVNKGWDKLPKEYKALGDEKIPAHGIEWVCNNWTNVNCLDFKMSHKSYEHQSLVSNKRVIDVIYNTTNHLPFIPKKNEKTINYEFTIL